LTVSHEKGYLLYDLTIKDESGHEINPNGCLWYYSGNTCTFEMPSSKVTITPKFTSKLNADGGLFINMPKSGTLTVDVPDDVSSFNVYDDGGVNGDYSSNCAGYLKLKTNTDSDKFSLNGSVYTEKGYDYFYVYDGLSTDDKMLIEKMDGTNNPINAVTSSHNKMMLKFSSDGSVFKSGLALTATVIRNLNSENITVADIPAQTYTGSAICPVVSVNYKGSELKAGTDYTVTCPYNVNPGTGSITITGKGNYAGSISKTFEILKAPLTVTAKNNTITYGDEPSNAGVEYEGFVNGETENVLNGELSYSYDYAKFGNVGEYAITPSGLTAGNYEIKYVAGKLKVEPKIISIAWGEQTVFTYDGEEHAPTATADGLLNNDECELAVTGAAVNPGNYTATVTGLSNTNYKLPENGTEKEFKIVAKPVEYIDEKGETKTVTDYTVLTNDISVDELSGGWYVVQGEVKYTSRIKFSGDAHLILADGAKMEIETEGEVEEGILTNGNLTIYGQSMQSGTLKVSSKGNYGIYSSVNITINGGSVTASGSKYGIGSEQGNITISGGKVTATGDDYGIFSREGNITLGWTNSTDFIKASSYYCKKGSVFIAEGKSFKDEKGYVYRGTLTGEQLSAIKGNKLEPCYAVTYDAQNGDDPIMLLATFDENGVAHVAKPADPIRSGFTFEGWFTAKDGNTEFDFSAPITGNTTVYAKWKENTPVEYIDENGKANSVTDYVLLTNDINVDNLPGGWYVVQGEVEYTSQVKFSGDAHLIFADEAKMAIETEGREGIYASNNLTIYGQSGQSGFLIVTAIGDYGCGIYSKGDITISGGTVTASNTSSIDAPICSKGGIKISGGKVSAYGNDYGIYSNKGDITISGGTVTAYGNDYGIYSYNGNITLGWTNSTDFIKANSYYSKNGVSITEGKYFKDEKGNVYSGPLSDDDLESIKNKTLVPSFNGTYLSDVNIAVADIPVQKYADGKPVCPSVLVTDGKDTLKAGTDYTVTCVNNTAVTTATLDEAAVAQITGKGNYAGVIQKRFFIWNNVGNYAAVQVFQDAGGNTHAEIDGAYDGTDAVAIDEDVENVAVKFNRKFTVNLENGGFSTIMFPFNVNASSLTGVKSIFEFAGVFKNNGKNAVGVKYVWCNAEQGKIEVDKGHPDCNEPSGELKAYTPYMVEMETPTLGIKDNVMLKSSNNATNSVVSKSNWVFRGALQKDEWSNEDVDIKNDQVWTFAASASNGTSIGKFVQFEGQNSVNPFQAYLYNLNGKQLAGTGELGSMDIVILADYIDYTAVQIFRVANGNKHAVIDGSYGASADEPEAVSIPADIEVNSVEMTREFPTGSDNAFSTTVLPFDVNTANVSGLRAVLRYNGIKNGSTISMKVLWAEKGYIKNKDGSDKEYEHAQMAANTPYLVLMKNSEFKLTSDAYPVTLKQTTLANTEIEGCNWVFHGTWKYKKWGSSCSTGKQDCDKETGFAYGFAASASEDNKIDVGTFVKVGEGAWIRPMRAYLVRKDKFQTPQFARANGAYVKRPTVEPEELPELMSIVIDGDGDENETTVIGQFNTRTGEFKMNYDRGKFDLKGRRVNSEKPNARGAYYGKKATVRHPER
jgi:uncharacterized repeat protein (TIGR02543 family)